MFPTDQEILSFYRYPKEYIEYLHIISECDISYCEQLESGTHSMVTDSTFFIMCLNADERSQWNQHIKLLSVEKFITINKQLLAEGNDAPIIMLGIIQTFVDKLASINIEYDLSKTMMIDLLDLWYTYSKMLSHSMIPLDITINTMKRFPDIVSHIVLNFEFEFYYKTNKSLDTYLNENSCDDLIKIHQKNINRYKMTNGSNVGINNAISPSYYFD